MSSGNLVMKFGGTSVADPDAINRLIAIVRQRVPASKAPAPVVVVSALSGVTDQLVEVTRLAEAGDNDGAVALLESLRGRHAAVATAMTVGSRVALGIGRCIPRGGNSAECNAGSVGIYFFVTL